MAESKDIFFSSRLVANQPVQIRGEFTGVRLMDGGHPQVYLFPENPGSSADLSQGIRLDMKGMVIHRKMLNPWVVSVGYSINEIAPELRLELFKREVTAVVDARSPEPLLTTTHGVKTSSTIATAGESLIGQALYGNQVVDDGQVLSPRAFWTGFAGGDGSFEVDLRARDSNNSWWTLISAPAKQTVSGEWALCLDAAAWDPQKSTTVGYSTFMTPSRLPVPMSSASGLWIRNTSGSLLTISSYVGIKAR